jgi:hypothetical protein
MSKSSNVGSKILNVSKNGIDFTVSPKHQTMFKNVIFVTWSYEHGDADFHEEIEAKYDLNKDQDLFEQLSLYLLKANEISKAIDNNRFYSMSFPEGLISQKNPCCVYVDGTDFHIELRYDKKYDSAVNYYASMYIIKVVYFDIHGVPYDIEYRVQEKS